MEMKYRFFSRTSSFKFIRVLPEERTEIASYHPGTEQAKHKMTKQHNNKDCCKREKQLQPLRPLFTILPHDGGENSIFSE